MGRFDAGRFTTHKIRAEWFQERTSYPKREVYPPALGEPRPTGGPLWTGIGPSDSGGRLTSLAVHPKNPDIVYVGAAGGGVWRSEDAGRKWKSIWDDQAPTLVIGSLALDPTEPYALYCGTGEANLTADNYPGVGLFRNRGAGWEMIGSSLNRVVEKAGAKFIEPGLSRRIGAIAVNPRNPNHIFVGGVTHSEEENAGLIVTRDGGVKWERCGDSKGTQILQDRPVFISGQNYFCHDVVFHPGRKGLVFATVQARGTQSGIWVSRDAGASWTQVKVKGISNDRFGRTSLAVARGSKTIYALSAETGGGNFLGVFRSDDLGKTWRHFHSRGLKEDGGLSYTNCIAMDPEDPMTAIAGSFDLHITRDGGATWRRISDGFAARSDPRYAHADHHAIKIIGKRVYSATDAGLAVSENGGRTWEMRTQGLAVSMFYDVDIAATDSRCLGGGMQDNGTWFAGPLTPAQRLLTGDAAKKRTAFRPQLSGDGGWTIYDPDDELHIFASAQRMRLFRHRGRRWKQLRTPFSSGERREVWMAVLAMDSSAKARKPRAVYIGSNRVWKSVNDGDTWRVVSPVFDGSVITAIEVATADPRRVYVGTMSGGFFRSLDSGKTWSMNLAGPGSASRTVTRIETYPADARVVYFTVGVIAEMLWLDKEGGLRADSRLARGGSPVTAGKRFGLIEFRHLYGSLNSGDTWFDADLGGLPNLPHQAVVITSGKTPLICAGHDAGVMAQSLQPGAFREWFNVTGNLPSVRVTDLVYHERDRLLIASTYGRGLWSIPTDTIEKIVANAASR